MLQPRKTKFRKYQKGVRSHKQKNLTRLHFGECGIKFLNSGVLSAKQIETLRRVLTRTLRRTGKIWIRVFPDHSVSRKPLEVRMGKGKGSPKFWIAKIPAGQIIFELSGVSVDLATQANYLISKKTSFQTKLVWAN